MDSGYHDIIKNIKAKIVRLNESYQAQKRVNDELVQKNQSLTAENNELKHRLQCLNDEMEALKLTYSLHQTNGTSEEAKSQVDDLIREIDNCITLINRL